MKCIAPLALILLSLMSGILLSAEDKSPELVIVKIDNTHELRKSYEVAKTRIIEEQKSCQGVKPLNIESLNNLLSAITNAGSCKDLLKKKNKIEKVVAIAGCASSILSSIELVDSASNTYKKYKQCDAINRIQNLDNQCKGSQSVSFITENKLYCYDTIDGDLLLIIDYKNDQIEFPK